MTKILTTKLSTCTPYVPFEDPDVILLGQNPGKGILKEGWWQAHPLKFGDVQVKAFDKNKLKVLRGAWWAHYVFHELVDEGCRPCVCNLSTVITDNNNILYEHVKKYSDEFWKLLEYNSVKVVITFGNKTYDMLSRLLIEEGWTEGHNGNYFVQYYIGEKAITKQFFIGSKEITVIKTPHPAWVDRFNKRKIVEKMYMSVIKNVQSMI